MSEKAASSADTTGKTLCQKPHGENEPQHREDN